MHRYLSIDERGGSAIHIRYAVNFYDDVINVYVTDCTEMVTIWLQVLEQHHRPRLDRLVVGLEVTCRQYVGHRAAILQLCVGDCCLIFQTLWANNGIPQKLRDFLAEERYTFVGVGIQNDVEVLLRDYRLRVGGRILDLSTLAAERGQNVGLRVNCLIRNLLRRCIERPTWIVRGRWDGRQLDPERVMYACLDPYVSCRVAQLLLNASDDS